MRRRRAVALVAALAADRGDRRGRLPQAPTTAQATEHGKAPLRAVSRPPTDPEQDEMEAVRSVLAYTPFVREGSGTANARSR